MKTLLISLIAVLLLGFTIVSCDKEPVDPEPDPDPTEDELYFPPVNGSEWQTLSPENLGWNTSKLPELYQHLEDGNTRAFLVLKNGKIVLEKYFGKDILGVGPFTASTNWYWASAGKTLTAFLTGLAQEDGYLDIDDPSVDYLGAGWSSLSAAQENAITVRHHLTMTTGLDDDAGNKDCTDPECLLYLAAPGTRWAYHNAPYTILDQVIEGASQRDFDDYFQERLAAPIGMDGFWTYLDYNHVYFSTARSMARFGLLNLNGGKWADRPVMADEQYFSEMVNPSQAINPSYGYLWWLNGQPFYKLPGFQFKINGSISPHAPADMISGLGKNGQFLNIIPSQNLIVVRMGDNPDNALVPVIFLDEMWENLSAVIK